MKYYQIFSHQWYQLWKLFITGNLWRNNLINLTFLFNNLLRINKCKLKSNWLPSLWIFKVHYLKYDPIGHT